MTLLIVLLIGLAVVAAALGWCNRLRWQRVSTRPVMTSEQVAGLPPGRVVVLTGRTADGPVIKAPLSRRECIGYRVKVGYQYSEGSNTVGWVDESEQRLGLPIRVGDGASAVSVDEQLAQRSLLRGRDALLGRLHMYQQTVKQFDGGKRSYSTTEEVVPASAAVLVTGMTSRDPGGGSMLIHGHWSDGTATMSLAEFHRRANRRIWPLAVAALVCGAAAAVLIGYGIAVA